jgi:5-methylcytosine-specific restriction enzyme A
MLRNPKWTEDELVLALDLFHDIPSGQINASNLRVIELSDTLNRLRSAEVRDDLKYRNPNGTALKLHNFSRFDSTRTARGMTHGGKLEEVLWRRYDGKRDLLKADAQAIHRKISAADRLSQ